MAPSRAHGLRREVGMSFFVALLDDRDSIKKVNNETPLLTSGSSEIPN